MTTNEESDPNRSIVTMTTGAAETHLPAEREEVRRILTVALEAPLEQRREAMAEAARMFPRSLSAWAFLGELARDDIEAYAYFRVGYHRGLDALRKAGWKGSGMLRWSNPENRAFLRCLDGLREAAAGIGEEDEAERCSIFLVQLDPNWGRRPADDRWWSASEGGQERSQ